MGTVVINKNPQCSEEPKDTTQLRDSLGNQKGRQDHIALFSRPISGQEVNTQQKTLKQDNRMEKMFDVCQYIHICLPAVNHWLTEIRT